MESVVLTCDIEPSPKITSPVASAIESRSTDEDLLVGMDIEQISDEELEDETRSGKCTFFYKLLLFFSYLFTAFLLFSDL